MKKATVIGAGISGLGIAKMLNERYDVLVIEKADKAGGLIKCDRVKGCLFHKVGGHVFNSKNQLVLDWFWQYFDKHKEFLSASRNAKILLQGKLIGYPIENHLYQLDEKDSRAIIEEMISLLENGENKNGHYENLRDFLVGSFGTLLYQLYFEPYNSKLWDTDLSKVPLEWLEGKLPMPKLKDVILSNIIKKEEHDMVHANFFYPKREGSQFIVDRLSEQLNIRLSYEVAEISYLKNNQLAINNKDILSNLIVYCGDIRRLNSIIKINDEKLAASLKAVTTLKSNGTSNVFCETDNNNISWLYLPENNFKAHRIIYTGNFSDSNNEGTKRKTCVVEFSGKHTKKTMTEELKRLPGNLKPLAFNYEPNSYIIQDKKTRKKITDLKENLQQYNIHLLGRFAEWEYYNMDKAIEAAMELNNELR